MAAVFRLVILRNCRLASVIQSETSEACGAQSETHDVCGAVDGVFDIFRASRNRSGNPLRSGSHYRTTCPAETRCWGSIISSRMRGPHNMVALSPLRPPPWPPMDPPRGEQHNPNRRRLATNRKKRAP